MVLEYSMAELKKKKNLHNYLSVFFKKFLILYTACLNKKSEIIANIYLVLENVKRI